MLFRSDLNNPDRPNLIPGRSNNPIVGTPQQWFDPRNFTLPNVGFYGTLGRNTLIGPPLADLDLSIEKTFAVRENLHLQFRAEFFNALNHTNFGLPLNSVFGSSGFYLPTAGLITSTSTPARQIQFGLKALF